MINSATKLYRFKFFDGQVFRARGVNERDALKRLGLESYNPVAYKCTVEPDHAHEAECREAALAAVAERERKKP